MERMDIVMKKLGFGLMRLPLLDPEDHKSVDIEKVKKMADEFLAKRRPPHPGHRADRLRL